MKKIIVRVPKRNEKWSVTFGGGAFRREDAYKVILFVERKMKLSLASRLKEKTAIKVIYDDGVNESTNSDDPKYLIYTLSCFLEDYLSDEVMLRIRKKYLK